MSKKAKTVSGKKIDPRKKQIEELRDRVSQEMENASWEREARQKTEEKEIKFRAERDRVSELLHKIDEDRESLAKRYREALSEASGLRVKLDEATYALHGEKRRQEVEKVCQEIVDAVELSIANRSFEFFYGEETTGNINFLEDMGDAWLAVLQPDAKEGDAYLMGLVEKGGVYEDSVIDAIHGNRELGLWVGIFMGARIAGASEERLRHLALKLMERVNHMDRSLGRVGKVEEKKTEGGRNV